MEQGRRTHAGPCLVLWVSCFSEPLAPGCLGSTLSPATADLTLQGSRSVPEIFSPLTAGPWQGSRVRYAETCAGVPCFSSLARARPLHLALLVLASRDGAGTRGPAKVERDPWFVRTGWFV